MEPIEWTEDGWFRTKPTATPITAGHQIKHGLQLSDDFKCPELGLQWTFWKQYAPEALRLEKGTLWMDACGETPADGRKLLVDVGDKRSLYDGGNSSRLCFFMYNICSCYVNLIYLCNQLRI